MFFATSNDVPSRDVAGCCEPFKREMVSTQVSENAIATRAVDGKGSTPNVSGSQKTYMNLQATDSNGKHANQEI